MGRGDQKEGYYRQTAVLGGGGGGIRRKGNTGRSLNILFTKTRKVGGRRKGGGGPRSLSLQQIRQSLVGMFLSTVK